MGGWESKNGSSIVVGHCSSPAYCIRVVGSRHILLGGGGGASKSGVPNDIQTLLLSFASIETMNSRAANETFSVQTKLTNTLQTDPHATMNMDCVLLGTPELGTYLLAAGHDEYCDIYESYGFSLTEADKDEKPSLALNFKKISRITSDEKPDNPYQKTVRFDRSSEGQPKKLFTGGADGCIRIWDVEALRKKSPVSKHVPLIAIQAHKGDIDDLDVSPNGKLCISVGHDCGVHIWNTLTGEKLRTLSIPEKIDDGFRVRSVRFTSLGSINTIFLATYNQIRLSKKAVSYAALWAFNHERSICRPILVREACRETISTLSVSDCGKFFAIGTMDGSVGIYDTHDLKPLYFSHKTHNIFVTGIDFLPRKTFDFGPLFGDNSRQRCIYPGIASEYRAAIISLSADQTVQFHSVPYSKPNSLTDFLLKLSFITLLLYYIIWYICDYQKINRLE